VAEIKGRGSVEVFAPGAKQPFRKITDGIRTPVALLFDSAGDLYVANCRSCYDYTDPRGGSVTEYAPGSATPIRVLKQGIEAPAALALGANGVLFVADDPFMGKTAVTVYSASSKKPVRRITDGISGPASLAIGPDGDLYVANYPCCGGDDSVTVYSPNGSRLVQKVRRGVKSPTAIAIGP
jgi:sugar lactone lactonase YvrE